MQDSANLSASHWYAPRNAALTPWYRPRGWMDLMAHHGSWGYRPMWKLVEEVHRRLPELASDVVPPNASELHEAQTTIYALQGKSPTLESMRARARALEIVAQAACVTQGQRASFPQLLAAFAMVHGYLIQLSPGEGKTLSIAIASVLLAWNGRPLHVVTANDYLAARDVDLMLPLYRFCGLSAIAITHETAPHELVSCYRQDIVYATAKQLLADFLRDDLAVDGARDPAARRLWHLQEKAEQGRQPVLRGLHAVIIDEADGVLIDEATTPLIIASPEVDKASMLNAIQAARDLANALQLETHYRLYTKTGNAVHFTEEGKQLIAELAQSFSAYWQVPSRREEIFSLAILAREVFQKDRHYVVQDGAVVIVDEGTGRSMPGRSWSHGVHQSIEAYLGLDMTPLTKISARMTFQEFFRHYHHLCGASGTLHSLDWELWNTFGLRILRIPPRAKSRLNVLPKRCFATREEKLEGFVRRIQDLHTLRLPILVGTRRILDSEAIAEILRERGFVCSVLNAKEHEREAEIVAQAGHWGCITVSTNMAGRGTDIHVPADVETSGGLQVLMFEAHESPRIDWQLFGRAGRQGAQGTAQAFVSLEEELLVKYLPPWFKPVAALIPSIRIQFKVHTLQWLAQRAARQIATHQRRQLAIMQSQLREQLGFSRA